MKMLQPRVANPQLKFNQFLVRPLLPNELWLEIFKHSLKRERKVLYVNKNIHAGPDIKLGYEPQTDLNGDLHDCFPSGIFTFTPVTLQDSILNFDCNSATIIRYRFEFRQNSMKIAEFNTDDLEQCSSGLHLEIVRDNWINTQAQMFYCHEKEEKHKLELLWVKIHSEVVFQAARGLLLV
ncbi:hypothetical protein G9A89_019558 [Geosiphon pyriformis]|nr:hypothetical protein G9A89_019558 [Geosiphon pyriformis]